MKNKYTLLIGVALFLVIAVLVGFIVFGSESEQEKCEAKGGRWDYVGLSPEKICNLPTTDGGKECNNSFECEGDCIADLSAADAETVMHSTPVNITGNCTHWKLTVGCIPFVENGTVNAIICYD